LVETYDRVGNERRERLFGGLQKRNFAVTQIVFLSEMEKIPRGEGNYKNIKVNIRRKCLENLSNILTNRANRVSLIVARDEDAPQIKHILRDYDRFSVNGEQFSMWSYHSGKVAWSENENIVRQHRQILEELKENSSFREPQAVLDLLSRLRETAEE
jgi:hypothetical protein